MEPQGNKELSPPRNTRSHAICSRVGPRQTARAPELSFNVRQTLDTALVLALKISSGFFLGRTDGDGTRNQKGSLLCAPSTPATPPPPVRGPGNAFSIPWRTRSHRQHTQGSPGRRVRKARADSRPRPPRPQDTARWLGGASAGA
uniref:Uncharacterized protein n=1 Tax=Myotis myotis TaxID=51298 RepID=A0A7J7TJE1_MYOMY|nr:hypothetical protein mMyoMyo1_009023 [Myotis myotis]